VDVSDWLDLATKAATLVGVVSGVIVSLGNRRVAKNNGQALQQISINVDGHLSRLISLNEIGAAELIATNKNLSHAEGRAEGVEAQTNRDKDSAR
jgi:hypothetical protein